MDLNRYASDAVSEPIFGKFQKKKTQIDRELYLIEKGGVCLL